MKKLSIALFLSTFITIYSSENSNVQSSGRQLLPSVRTIVAEQATILAQQAQEIIELKNKITQLELATRQGSRNE